MIRKRRIRTAGLCLGTTLCLLPAAAPPCAAAQVFPDVPEKAWCSEAVTATKELSIVEGYPDGSFRPEEKVSCGEFLRMALQKTVEVQRGEHWASRLYYEGLYEGLYFYYENGHLMTGHSQPDIPGDLHFRDRITVHSREGPGTPTIWESDMFSRFSSSQPLNVMIRFTAYYGKGVTLSCDVPIIFLQGLGRCSCTAIAERQKRRAACFTQAAQIRSFNSILFLDHGFRMSGIADKGVDRAAQFGFDKPFQL